MDAMKKKIRPTLPTPLAQRKSIVIKSKIGRVITRSYVPAGEERIRKLVNHVLNLDEEWVSAILETLLHNFSHRHRYFRQSLERNFDHVARFVPDVDQVSKQQQLLIGAYFTAEYSVEAAALFNPCIVQIASQEADPEGLLPVRYELPRHG